MSGDDFKMSGPVGRPQRPCQGNIESLKVKAKPIGLLRTRRTSMYVSEQVHNTSMYPSFGMGIPKDQQPPRRTTASA